MNPYEILGIQKGSTEKEIKRAFRRLAMMHHPDRKTGNEEMFKKCYEAYQQVLKAEGVKDIRVETSADYGAFYWDWRNNELHGFDYKKEKHFPYWRNGFVYYSETDTGSFVGDMENQLN